MDTGSRHNADPKVHVPVGVCHTTPDTPLPLPPVYCTACSCCHLRELGFVPDDRHGQMQQRSRDVHQKLLRCGLVRIAI